MDPTITNPPNPYVGPLRIFSGTLVKISGKPRVNATRFAINFQTGPSLNPRDDLALHLSPCFTPPRIVRNSLRNGAWGIEESWGGGTIMNPHEAFEIMILTENDQFKIALNGSHFCEFRHRIPFHEIAYLSIDGDVDIRTISVTSSGYSPPQPSYHPPGPTPAGYPNLYPPQPAAFPMPMPAPHGGPTSTGASYHSGPPGPTYPSHGPTPAGYPSGGPIPAGYPSAGPAYPQGPTPTGAHYGSGFPAQHPHAAGGSGGQQSSSIFGSLPIGGKALGTLAGLGLGAAVGATVLKAANPLKLVKKSKKAFKHKGWGRSSSSSSNSSRSSFSSNSS